MCRFKALSFLDGIRGRDNAVRPSPWTLDPLGESPSTASRARRGAELRVELFSQLLVWTYHWPRPTNPTT